MSRVEELLHLYPEQAILEQVISLAMPRALILYF